MHLIPLQNYQIFVISCFKDTTLQPERKALSKLGSVLMAHLLVSCVKIDILPIQSV